MPHNPLLDNVFWHALSGSHLRLSTGTDSARRYAPGFSPIVAFAEPRAPDFEALTPFCKPGEQFYCEGWAGNAARGWNVEAEATMYRMVWARPMPEGDSAPDTLALGPEHSVQALDLAALTRPGPFGPRTLEMGEYFGIFNGPQLAAMAGERAFAGTLREISGVCTHPDAQGRGLAKRLMLKLMRRQMQRGEQPFLHVMRSNKTAHGFYERMGFDTWGECVVRVVAFQ